MWHLYVQLFNLHAAVVLPHICCIGLCYVQSNYSAYSFGFLRAKAAMLSARLSHHNSVHLSIRLSVCLLHRWIRQKRSKLGSPNLHHRLPGRL